MSPRSVLGWIIGVLALFAVWNVVLFVMHGEAVNLLAVVCCFCSGAFCATTRRGLR